VRRGFEVIMPKSMKGSDGLDIVGPGGSCGDLDEEI
jgi:hypothetical protein